MIRRCEFCGGDLPTLARSDARVCSGRCRVAAHRRHRGVPAELRERPRWVRRSASKVPLTVVGTAASSTNRATWATFEQARASDAGVGLGFVLNGDGVVCLDLDHCLVDGEPTPWAKRLLTRLPDTFVEVSPSGDGLHVWGYGTVRRGGRVPVDGGGSVEMYGWGRYMTVTGRRFGRRPLRLADLTQVIESLR